MVDLEDDFARLGLKPGANPQDVRRAYARELKTIDQENDAAGFQALRQAYESAWRFAESLSPAVTQEPEIRNAWAAPSSDNFAPTPPIPLANSAAFEQFLAASARLARASHEQDAAAWVALLKEHLASEQLIALTARDEFELHVVAALTGVWRAGNDALFAAAEQVFGWSDDASLLQRFGHRGGLIQQALDQQQLFSNVAPKEQAAQRDVLARLRDPRAPSREEFRRDRFHIERMVARYPAMLALVVDAERLQHWRVGYRDMPGMPRASGLASGQYAADPAMAYWPARQGNTLGPWAIAETVISLVLAFFYLISWLS